MKPKRPSSFTFPVLRPMFEGIGFVVANWRASVRLALLPLIAILLCQYAAIELADGLFWANIIQLPGKFLLGAYSVLIIFGTWQDHELRAKRGAGTGPIRPVFMGWRNFFLLIRSDEAGPSNVLAAALAFATVNYVYGGFFSGFNMLGSYIGLPDLYAELDHGTFPTADQNVQVPLPIMAGVLFAFIVMLWGMRYYWMHVIITLGLGVRTTYRKLGGMEASVLIGLMYLASYLICLLTLSLILTMVMPVFGVSTSADLTGIAMWVRDVLAIFTVVIAHAVFAAASTLALLAVKSTPDGPEEE